ncbi:MAG: hypothetical protein ABI693_04980 [Bryobacteraceae bacterium]
MVVKTAYSLMMTLVLLNIASPSVFLKLTSSEKATPAVAGSFALHYMPYIRRGI